MVRQAPEPTIIKHRANCKPEVYRWCSDMRLTGKTGADCTHTVMDSRIAKFGVLRIPDDKVSEFLSEYAFSIAKKEELYIIERIADKDAPRRMYLDLDLHFTDDLKDVDDHELFDDTIEMIFEAVKDYSKDADEMYVLSAGMTWDQEKSESRLGLHIIWPKFIVTQPVALSVRRGLLVTILHHTGTRFADKASIAGHQATEPWVNVVDEAVLTGQTLRMPYSRKAQLAPTVVACFCGALQQKMACVCCRGVKDLGRPYLPFAKINDQDGLCDIQNAEVLDILKVATIRVPKETPLSNTEVAANDFVDAMPDEALQSKAAIKAAGKPVQDPAIRALVSDYCMCFWRPYFTPERPITVKQQGSRTYVVATHNTRCCNALTGQHTSAASKLVFRADGIVQHSCWSTKNAKRRFQRCGKAQAVHCEHKMTPAMTLLLFPKKPRSAPGPGPGPAAKKPRLNVNDDDDVCDEME